MVAYQPCYHIVVSIQAPLAIWLYVQLTRTILCMGSLEDIPDVGNIHMTSVQVFSVRDSYLVKTTTRMGGLEGGRLEKGEMVPHTWGRKMCMGAG